MATTTSAITSNIQQLTREEGMALLDEQARRYLNMSGAEFLRAWDAGEIDPDDPEIHGAVIHLEFLLPFAREVAASGNPDSTRSSRPGG